MCRLWKVFPITSILLSGLNGFWYSQGIYIDSFVDIGKWIQDFVSLKLQNKEMASRTDPITCVIGLKVSKMGKKDRKLINKAVKKVNKIQVLRWFEYIFLIRFLNRIDHV